MKVPFLDLKAQFTRIRTEVMAAIGAVCEEQGFILGQRVAELEKALEDFVGC